MPDTSILGYRITPPQSGLVQLGNTPFYATPNTPADPTDCERYPNSIYCNGRGFGFKSISLNVGLVADKCNVGVQINGTLAYVSLPTVDIVYRSPNCRVELPPPDPVTSNESDIPIPTTPDCASPLGFAYVKRKEAAEQMLVSAGLATISTIVTTEVVHISYPVVFSNAEVHHENGAVITLQVTAETKRNMPWLQTFGGYSLDLPLEQQQDLKLTFNRVYNVWSQSNDVSRQRYLDYTDYWLYPADGTDNNGTFIVTYGAGISDWRSSGIRTVSNFRFIDGYNRAINSDVTYYGNHIVTKWDVILTCGDYVPPVNKYPPPPPKKKKCCKDDDMTCCPDNSDLLKALLAKVNKLSQIVGVDEYPASLPASLVTKDGKNPGKTSIPNLTELFGWYIQRFDEIMGQFEINLEVAKPDKEGETIPIKLPNMAEAIAEMMTLMFQTSINSEILVNLCNRTLIETGQNKQQEFKNHMAINSLIEYFGFGIKETAETMPLTFTPGETSFSKMLQETNISVKGTEYDGKQPFHGALLDLLQAAAIIRAVHWKKLDASKNIAQQLIDSIVAAKAVKDTLFSHDDCLNFDVNELIQDVSSDNKKSGLTVSPSTTTQSTGTTGSE